MSFLAAEEHFGVVLDNGFEAREFEHQSSYYIYFQTNTLDKGMNPLIPQTMGQIVWLLFF